MELEALSEKEQAELASEEKADEEREAEQIELAAQMSEATDNVINGLKEIGIL